MNSALSVYCFPQIVQVEGFSGDIKEDDDCNGEEERASEDADSASEHEDAEGDGAIEGDAGDEEDDNALDCKVDAKFIVAADFTGIRVAFSIPSGTGSIGFPSLILFAIDRAEDALTTR